MVQTGGMPGYGGSGPALSADQINAAMGFNPNAAQFNPWANTPGGFGGQTDYYSALGAAYGRNTGGFNAGGAAAAGMPEWQYNQMMKEYASGYAPEAVTRGPDLPAPDTSGYNPIQPPPPQPPAGGGGGGGGGGWQGGGAAASGMPEWQYNQMMKEYAAPANPYAGLILGPEGNPGYFNPGTYAGDKNNYGIPNNGLKMPGDIGFTKQPQNPNLGYNPGMENWFANPGMGGGGFQERFGMGFPNSGTPSQVYPDYSNNPLTPNDIYSAPHDIWGGNVGGAGG
jgi:hypothetical protein